MLETSAASASATDAGEDLYQKLMGQEERVLRTVNRLAAAEFVFIRIRTTV
jgi:hypothetical protein